MAYNVLKGTVEGSVDQHADQEIDGIKVFKSTISASVFYDTDARSPCATMKDVAITQIRTDHPKGVLTSLGNGIVEAQEGLIYENETLTVKNICADNLKGSALNLCDVPADKFAAPIGADQIKLGNGIVEMDGALQVRPWKGITVGRRGIGLSLSPQGGLDLSDGQLTLDLTQAPSIREGGQNLSDQDVLLVSDVSQGRVCASTLGNLYNNYIKVKIPHAVGVKGEIQLKGPSGLASSPKLTYDINKEVLTAQGTISTTNVHIQKSLVCQGAVIKNVKTVKNEIYDVENNDHTILCNTIDNPVFITLPAPHEHPGRIVVIKKTTKQKRSVRSFPIGVRVLEGTIDGEPKILMKTNYSSRVFQSDGDNWWVIGSKGT